MQGELGSIISAPSGHPPCCSDISFNKVFSRCILYILTPTKNAFPPLLSGLALFFFPVSFPPSTPTPLLTILLVVGTPSQHFILYVLHQAGFPPNSCSSYFFGHEVRKEWGRKVWKQRGQSEWHLTGQQLVASLQGQFGCHLQTE